MKILHDKPIQICDVHIKIMQQTLCLTYSLCAQSEVEETEGAFDASMYSIRVALVKSNGNQKIDAIH